MHCTEGVPSSKAFAGFEKVLRRKVYILVFERCHSPGAPSPSQRGGGRSVDVQPNTFPPCPARL